MHRMHVHPPSPPLCIPPPGHVHPPLPSLKGLLWEKMRHPLSFVAVFGSGIRDPGWVKIRIRDPGSTSRIRNTASNNYIIKPRFREDFPAVKPLSLDSTSNKYIIKPRFQEDFPAVKPLPLDSGVHRGDAQDARASPLPPPLCIPPSPAWKAGYEKRWGSGHWASRKKCKVVYLRLDNFLPRTVSLYTKKTESEPGEAEGRKQDTVIVCARYR